MGAATTSGLVAFGGSRSFIGGGEFRPRQYSLQIVVLFPAVDEGEVLANFFHGRAVKVVEEVWQS